MDSSGDHVFAGTGFARHQDGHIDTCRLPNELLDLPHPCAAPELHLLFGRAERGLLRLDRHLSWNFIDSELLGELSVGGGQAYTFGSRRRRRIKRFLCGGRIVSHKVAGSGKRYATGMGGVANPCKDP